MLRRFGVSALALVVTFLVMFALFTPRSTAAPTDVAQFQAAVSSGLTIASAIPASPAIAISNPFYLPMNIFRAPAEPGLRAAIFDRSRESFVSSVVAGRTWNYCDGSSLCSTQQSRVTASTSKLRL